MTTLGLAKHVLLFIAVTGAPCDLYCSTHRRIGLIASHDLLQERSSALRLPITVTPSEPKALAVIEASIVAMGGRITWSKVGGVTAHATISRGSEAKRSVDWTDDWSKGHIRFRRDSLSGTATKSSMIGTDGNHIYMMPEGKSRVLQPENGVAVLARNYPAPALILSVTKYDCTFTIGKFIDPRLPLPADDSDDTVVTESCPDVSYPSGKALMLWTFSKSTALPKSVEVPIWGQTHHIILRETVYFASFQSVEDKMIPSHLKIIRISGNADDVSVSDTTFVRGVEDREFIGGK